MKKILLVIIFIFLLINVFSAKIEKNSINVIVDSKGTALIEETYFVLFEKEESDLFSQTITEGISLEILQDFGLEIKPRLENTEAIISFEDTETNKRIKLNYFSNNLFSVKNKIEFNEFSLNKSKLLFLFSGKKVSFPENFSLRFVLPKEAKTIKVLPETTVLSNTTEWKGPLIGEELLLSYSINKTPEPITISQINIEIKVKENGFGKISEKYFFDFRNKDELSYFIETSQKNGSSLLSWNTFDGRIFPHIGEDEFDTKNATVEFVEKGLTNSFLSIVYENESPVFIEKKERNERFVKWEFNPRKLNKLLSGGVIILPENTALEITLPLNAKIKETNLEIENEKIVWEGYKTSSQINIVFVIKENIAPTFNLSLMIQGIFSSRETAAGSLIVLLVTALVLYVKRDLLTEKIDSFVIKNSKIEKSEESEIEIDE